MSSLPTLIGCTTTDDARRCLLQLSDGETAAIGISSVALARLLGGSLSEVLSRGVDVYLPHPPMSDEDWSALSAHLDPAQFAGDEQIDQLLRMSASQLAALPLRVYGGTDMGRTLYLSRPVNFRRVKAGTFGALLNHRDQLWRVRVDLSSGAVEVDSGTAPGHFAAETA